MNVWLENIFASDPAKCGAEMENKQNMELFLVRLVLVFGI